MSTTTNSRLTLQLDAALLARLRSVSRKYGISQSRLVRRALRPADRIERAGLSYAQSRGLVTREPEPAKSS